DALASTDRRRSSPPLAAIRPYARNRESILARSAASDPVAETTTRADVRGSLFSMRPPRRSGTVTPMSLDGKVAVVTGATRGVGRGIARELARNGARVFVTGRSTEDAGPLEERATSIRCDHRQDAEVQDAFARVLREADTIDILVNNVWGGYER